MEHWYALHAKPHKERQVAEHLRQNKLQVYLPLARMYSAASPSAAERPFFPCYLFAKADLDTVGVSALQWTPGLRRMVEFGGEPAVVPDHFMAELKRRMAQIRTAGGVVFDDLKHGDKVKIVAGPFAGYEAIFYLHLPGTDRVRLLIEFIEQNQRHRSRRELRDARPPVIPVELNAGSIVKARPER